MSLHLQAAADARESEDAQVAWLQANLSPLFARRLLRIVHDIASYIAPHTGNPSHQYPLLAGSHLTQVRTCACRCMRFAR